MTPEASTFVAARRRRVMDTWNASHEYRSRLNKSVRFIYALRRIWYWDIQLWLSKGGRDAIESTDKFVLRLEIIQCDMAMVANFCSLMMSFLSSRVLYLMMSRVTWDFKDRAFEKSDVKLIAIPPENFMLYFTIAAEKVDAVVLPCAKKMRLETTPIYYY